MITLSRLASIKGQLYPGFRRHPFSSAKMSNFSIDSKHLLLSGHQIPALGYGTGGPPKNVYQTPAEVAEDVVSYALKTGYRHVDSARVYRNEGPCSDAIKKSGIPRSEIFFTSKVPPRSIGYEATKASIESSFKQTGLDYIDLYLIHAPYGGKDARNGSWKALVEAQQAGQIRSLGVSNYGVHHLDELESYIKELEDKNGKGKGGEISVGQWELHPWLARPDIVEWCQKRGIILEAYCPLVRGIRFGEPILRSLVKKYDKTAAQILIRWSLQKNFVPLPKSVTLSRIEENSKVYDFELTPEDMKSLETGEYSPCSWDPTTSDD